MPSVSCRHKTIAEAVLTLLRWANAIQDELGKALDTMEGMVALEKNLNQASWGLYTKLCMDQPLAL